MNEGESTISGKTVKKTARKSVKAPAAPKAPKAVKVVVAPAVILAEVPAVKAAPAAALTTIVAKVDVGFGNMLFLRGTGPGLSWEKGVEMTNSGTDEWTWSTTKASADFVAKVLVNDVIWSFEPDSIIAAGSKTVIVPTF
jgi:hypothetical protein